MIESRCGIMCSRCDYREKMNCAGCLNIDKPFWGDSCDVKTCCEERGYKYCGQCPDFPCETLKAMSYADEEGDNGERIENCRMWAKKEKQMLIEKASKIINSRTASSETGNWETAIAILALIDDNGFPTASTLSMAGADGVNEISFVTGLGANKVNRINKSNKASVCINSGHYNITLVGIIEVLTDAQTKKDTWYEGCEHHFTSVEDPNYCVLKFTTKRYCIYIGDEEIEGTL